jgi:hypothetical protein
MAAVCIKAILSHHSYLSLPLTRLATERGIFSKIRGRTTGIRISLHANDVALFLAPIKEEGPPLQSC